VRARRMRFASATMRKAEFCTRERFCEPSDCVWASADLITTESA
jgi:hypothetical protein